MRKHFKKYIGLVLAFVMSFALAGCESNGGDPLAVAVVAGIHANAGSIPLNAETVTEQLYQACRTNGSVTVICADGEPSVAFDASIPAPEVSGLSGTKLDGIAHGYVAQIQDVLSDISPQAPEVDTLEAIRMGGQALSQKEGEKVLLVLDTGLSTTGYMDFTDGLLQCDPTATVSALAEAQALPDLEGITVLWAFCGQTAQPQPALSQKEKNNLASIWEAVLLASSATEVQFLSDFAGEGYSNMPAVSLVETEEQTIQVEQIKTTVLSDTKVQFVGDSDQFVDYATASEALSDAAEQLLKNTGRKAYIVGTTAGGVNETYCLELSKARAEAVKRALTERWSIPEGQLICVGLGASDPWHVSDLNDEGIQIEEYAAQNRKVVLLDTEGSDAALIKPLLP